MALNFKLILLLIPNIILSQSFYYNKNHFSIDFGTILNQSKSMNFTTEIKPLVAIDLNVSFSFETFKNKTGWLFTCGGGTQGLRYKRKNQDGSYNTSNTVIGNKDGGRYFFGVKKTYNFNACKNINFILGIGPNVLFNRNTENYDSLRVIPISNAIAYSIKPLGVAVQSNLRVVIKGKKNIKFYLLAGYQIGFINHREARILTSDLLSQEMFTFNGTGANFGFGFLFINKKATKLSETKKE